MDAFYHQRRQHREQKMDQNYEYEDYDENGDPDYFLALALSEELNGPGAASGVDRPRDSNKKITNMLTVFKGENKAYVKLPAKRKPSAGFCTPSATSRSTSESASKTGEQLTRDVIHEPETSSAYFILNTFPEFIEYIKTRRCSQCRELFVASRLDVLTPFQNWMDGVVDTLSCIVRCKSCATSICIACTPEVFPKLSKSKIRSSKQEVAWCCASGRLFLIWTLLCGFDTHLSESRKIDKTSKPPTPDTSPSHSRRGKRSMESHVSGVGYGGPRYPKAYWPQGTSHDSHADDEIGGYSSELEDIDHLEDLLKADEYAAAHWEASPPSKKRKDSMPKAQIAQMSEDRLGKLTLGFLTDLLPSLERDTCFDYDPPVAVLEMLRGSKILDYCAELLRNDSLVDIVKRKELYQNLFSFLNTLGSHFSTGEALFCARFIRPKAIDLFTLSFCDEDPGQKETVPALADGLRNLTAQSSLVLQSAAKNQAAFANDDGLTMLGICRQVSSLAEFIRANNPRHTNGKEKIVDPAIPEALHFTSVEKTQILPTYRFASDAQKLKTSQPGRFKRLITEITTLQTSLPPGIFVRYCEDRPDILKCVIIGPVGTPYENGMFEFDIFCGANFPNEPPRVSFKGTGGGKAAINPNLYPDGKVCLSLLGTWSGERWDSKTSTLLQVLVSIQAMILCAEPWYNEPGREANYYTLTADTPSARYNMGVRMDTVRWAMLHHWLEDSPKLWRDLVTYHFTNHGNDILKKVEEWANEAAKATRQPLKRRDIFSHQWALPGSPLPRDAETASKAAAEGLVFKLQEALKQYGATYKINYVPPPPGPPSPTTRPRSDSVSQLSPTWATYDFEMPPEIPDYPETPHNSDYLFFHPPPLAPGAGLGTMGSALPSLNAHSFGGFFGTASKSKNPPPSPGPLIVSSSGPPSSNTRSAARGRGSGAEASAHQGRGVETSSPRGRGSGVEASSHRGRGGPSQSPLPSPFGRGSGAVNFFSLPEEHYGYTVANTTHGGRGGLGLGGFGPGRGRGRGDRGGRGGY